jgi:hypothetical protein
VAVVHLETIRHGELLIQFWCEPASDDSRTISYKYTYDIAPALGPPQWQGPTGFDFPATMRPLGYDLFEVAVTGNPADSSQPFQLFSDGAYLYVFRVSDAGTLLVDRFLAAKTPGASSNSSSDLWQLTWVPEVRYCGSGNRDLPAGDTDTLGVTGSAGQSFYEPTIELSMVQGFEGGWFHVFQVPAVDSSQQLWQVLSCQAAAAGSTPTQFALFTFNVDDRGHFSPEGLEPDPQTHLISPDAMFQIALDGDPTSAPLSIATGPAAALYAKQERCSTGDGQTLMFGRNYRVQIATGASSAASSGLAVIDLPVASDGSLLPADSSLQTLLVSPTQAGGLVLRLFDQAQVTLPDDGQPLQGPFTVELWVNPSTLSGTQDLIGSGTAPLLQLVDGQVVGAGGLVTAALPSGSAGNWVHLALVSAKELILFVNGENAAQGSTAPPQSIPKPAFIGRATSGIAGFMTEIRVWTEARTQDEIQSHLYRRLTDDEINEDLYGYWTCDALMANGASLMLPDRGLSHLDGTCVGASLAATTNPIADGSAPSRRLDPRGLEQNGSFVDKTTTDRPFILSSADGSVTIYFVDPDGELASLQYDAETARAVYETVATAPTSGQDDIPSSVRFVSLRTGDALNQATIAIAALAEPHADRFCRLTIGKDGLPQLAETWTLPRDAADFCRVLQGEAVADPDDPRVQSAEAPFFDYEGRYISGILPCASGWLEMVGRDPSSATLDDMLLYLQKITVSTVPDGAQLTVALGALPDGSGNELQFQQVWSALPLAADALLRVLRGDDPDYDYTLGASSSPAWALQSDGAPLILVSQTAVLQSLQVGPGTAAGTCTIQAVVSGNNVTIANVSRAVTAACAVLRESLRSYGVYAAAVAGEGNILDQTVSAPGDLRLLAGMTTIVNCRASGPVTSLSMSAAPLRRAAVPSFWNAARGSSVFAATPKQGAITGRRPTVQNTSCVQIQAGASGGWVAALPRYSVDSGPNNSALVLAQADALIARLAKGFTVEGWIATPLAGQAAAISDGTLASWTSSNGSTPTSLVVLAAPCLEYTVSKSNSPIFGNNFWPSNTVYSMQFWFKTSDDFEGMLAQYSYNSSNFEEYLGVFDGELVFSSLGRLLQTGLYLPPRSWTNLTLVRDTSQAALYVDGERVAQFQDLTSINSDNPNQSMGFAVGTSLRSPDGTGSCCFNDFRIWFRAISEEEIGAVWAASGQVLEYYVLTANNIHNGPFARWLLNQTEGNIAVDISGNGNDSMPVANASPLQWVGGGALASIEAKLGRACMRASIYRTGNSPWMHVAFAGQVGAGIALGSSGQRDYVDCGNEDDLELEDNFTVEAWIQSAGTARRRQQILGKGTVAAANANYVLGLDVSGQPYFGVTITDGTTPSYLEVNATTGKSSDGEGIEYGLAHHLVGLCQMQTSNDSGNVQQTWTLTILIDGKTAYSLSYAPQNSSTPLGSVTDRSNLLLGAAAAAANVASADAYGDYYGGVLADVRIWARALGADEIASLATGAPPLDADGLVSWWDFSEKKGRTANDRVGDSTATLSAGIAWVDFDLLSLLGLYADGELCADAARSIASPMSMQSAFSVGGTLDPAGNVIWSYSGGMAEMRLWDRVITAAQIAARRQNALTGREQGLAGYWPLSAGSGNVVEDMTAARNHLQGRPSILWQQEGPPLRAASAAPRSRRATKAGKAAGAGAPKASGSVSAVEYLVPAANSCPVYRYLSFLDQDGNLSGTRSLDMIGYCDQRVLGQVQTGATLIGYIESAPPLPSENLTQPYWTNYGWTDYREYADKATVTLEINTEQAVGAETQLARGGIFDIKSQGGGAINAVYQTPLFQIFSAKGKLFAGTALGTRFGDESKSTLASKTIKTYETSLSAQGDWEPADAILNAVVGRRFVPFAEGLALVRSRTADLVSYVMEGTGVVFQTSVQPPDDSAPQSINLIPFRLNPGYLLPGSLDGRVGNVVLPSAGTSYYQPEVAQQLIDNMDKAEKQLDAAWGSLGSSNQLAAQADARVAALENVQIGGESSFDEVAIKPPSAANISAFTSDVGGEQMLRGSALGTVATYVWNSRGGLYAETEARETSYSEDYGWQTEGQLTVTANFEGDLTIIGYGFGFAMEAQVGAYWNSAFSATKSFDSTITLGVELDCERFLKGAVVDQSSLTVTGYTSYEIPGKVRQYRFNSFWLAPDAAHWQDLFNDVIDPLWLETSPDAAVLRDLQNSSKNPVWRVRHLVNYVERVQASRQPFAQTAVASVPANLGANALLIRMVQQALGDRPPVDASMLVHAVEQVLGDWLPAAIPWWSTSYQADANTLNNLAIQYCAIAMPFLMLPSQRSLHRGLRFRDLPKRIGQRRRRGNLQTGPRLKRRRLGVARNWTLR